MRRSLRQAPGPRRHLDPLLPVKQLEDPLRARHRPVQDVVLLAHVPQGYDGEFYGAGAFGQYLWIDTRRGVVVAQFAAQIPGDVEDGERNAAFRALASAVRTP